MPGKAGSAAAIFISNAATNDFIDKLRENMLPLCGRQSVNGTEFQNRPKRHPATTKATTKNGY
ncbi:MAG: hypothetical protein HQK95_01030 [Nitrospirae bacterium]|nr:hypothetical protein [Nitrospirota bacterium]